MKTLILILLFVFSTAQAAERYQLHANPKLVKLSKILVLESVGIEEETGRNDGDDVEGFLNDLGLRKGSAWCSAFEVSMYMRACYALKWSLDSIPFKLTALANGVFNSAKKGTKTAYKAFDDDFIVWYLPGTSNGHIGRILFIIDDKRVLTVEGNTSGRTEFDGVNINERSIYGNLGQKKVRGLVGV
jgi:hypothetical protein